MEFQISPRVAEAFASATATHMRGCANTAQTLEERERWITLWITFRDADNATLFVPDDCARLMCRVWGDPRVWENETTRQTVKDELRPQWFDAQILDCGHAPTKTPGPGTGYATDRLTGERRCYACADEQQREVLKTADAFSGYLTDRDRSVITTWTGGVLAKVVSFGIGNKRFTPTGGYYRMRTVRAKTPDGALWYGSGGDTMDAITLRRLT